MEDPVFQSELYHDAVSDDEEIQIGDMVAWKHDESINGQVIELFLSNEYVGTDTKNHKNNIYLIADSHSWKVEDIGLSTFRDNLLFRIVRVKIRTGEIKEMLLDECIPA